MSRAELASLLVVAVALLTMPVFALVARGRPVDVEVARRPRTVLLGTWVRDWLMWLIGPLVRASVAARVPPVAFNVLGALLGMAAGAAYAAGALALGGWLVLLGGAADIFDGRVARARGLVSRAGAFLDSTLDRFAETFTFAGLALYHRDAPWRVLATALALGGSLLVSYTRARGEGLGIECRGGVMQRAERLVLLAVASVLDHTVSALAGWPDGSLLVAAVALIAAGSLGTALWRTAAIVRALEREDSGER
ncbi:MAG: CDP-alcohol phosphatidyltransferase family protein [Candidatus Eisenbacteria bacterium]|nr:CDP-alcohol phosphatidyltransferase family protein [Candidatus Eisenbacteria bacterium]